jgi:hypothetical protein
MGGRAEVTPSEVRAKLQRVLDEKESALRFQAVSAAGYARTPADQYDDDVLETVAGVNARRAASLAHQVIAIRYALTLLP